MTQPSRQILRIAAGLALLLPLTAEADTTFFYHWGTVESNSELLRRGGFPTDGSYSNDLQEGSEAHLNENVLGLVRDWFLNGGRGDAAGPGLYMSSDISDSKMYGPDLLIVEVRTPPGVLPAFPDNPRIVVAAYGALLNHDFSGIPLASRYNGNWHVISRAIDPGRDPGIDIVFRPPRPSDEQRLWHAFAATQAPEARMQTVAHIATMISECQRGADRAKMTRSSEILLRRMFFDSGPAFIEEAIAAYPPEKRELATQALGTILATYQRIAPDDPRLQAMTRKWFDLFRANPSYLLSGLQGGSEVGAFTSGLKQLSAAERAAFLKKVFDLFKGGLDGVGILPLLDCLADALTVQERVGLRTVLESALKKTPPAINNLTKYLTDFEKIFGAQSVDGLVESCHTSWLGHQATLPPGSAFDLAANREGPEYLNYFSRKGVAALEQAVQRSLTLTATASEEVRSKILLSSIVAIQRVADPVRSPLYPVFKRQLQDFAQAGRLGALPDMGNWLYAQGGQEPIFSAVLKDYPELSVDFREGLLKALNFNLTDKFAATYNFAVTNAKKMPFSLRLETEFQAARAQTGGALTREDFTARMSKVLQNIPGSQEYSDLSRTFALVDADLAFEDLRNNESGTPWLRFNKSYLDNGREFTRQANWEIFSNVWDSFAPDLLLARTAREAALKSGRLTNAFSNANRLLVKNKLEDSSAENPDWWKRESQSSFISRENWTALKLDSLRGDLSRYFHIIESPDSFELKVLDFEGLKTQIPRLRTLPPLPADAMVAFIESEVAKLKSPVQRAARVLYLFTRLQPYGRGNAKLARLWASQELVQAGLPMPVGFSRNDVFYSQRQTELEVRKSVRLGKFWEDMILAAKAKGVAPADFFQKVFKGCALEGLINLQMTDIDELAGYVTWLEGQDVPPAWGKGLAAALEAKTMELGKAGRALATYSDIERTQTFGDVWKQYQSVHVGEIPRFLDYRQGVVRTLKPWCALKGLIP